VRVASGVAGGCFESMPRGYGNGNILLGVAATTTQPMERFVQFIVVGGLALLAGLWGSQIVDEFSQAWLGSVAVAVVGVLALAVGINSQIEY